MNVIINSKNKVEYKTKGSAGFDLCSAVDIDVMPKTGAVISTGFRIAIPEGYEGQVRGRSGLNFKNSMIVPTGTIDSDYRGEVKVKIYNLSDSMFKIKSGDRIAQMIIAPIEQVDFKYVDDSEFENLTTERGDGGFGSTGV